MSPLLSSLQATMYADVQNSKTLAASYQSIMSEKFNIDVEWTPFNASSDFGDVTCEFKRS